jgi:hypothetical protein
MNTVFVIGGTIIAWTVVLGILFLIRNMPRSVFISLHYIADIVIFGILAFIIKRADIHFSPAALTIIIVGTLLAIELFYWVFVNPAGAGRYLTVIDWIIPAILVVGTVYLTAIFVKS